MVDIFLYAFMLEMLKKSGRAGSTIKERSAIKKNGGVALTTDITNIYDLDFNHSRYEPYDYNQPRHFKLSNFAGGSKIKDIRKSLKKLYECYASGMPSPIKELKPKIYTQRKSRGGEDFSVSQKDMKNTQDMDFSKPYSGTFPVKRFDYPYSQFAKM